MDIIQQWRQAGALCANDAKSCYDSIVHCVTLALRRLGMSPEPISSMFETLQKACHHVSTAFGTSSQNYGGRRQPPLQGVGQGNEAGPAIWGAISTVIILAMATQGRGFNILSALSATLLVSFVCYAFVDDTDEIHSASTSDIPGEEVIVEMQEVLDRWGGTLRATGGALIPKKSYWYAIDFLWDGNSWKYRNKEEMPGDHTEEAQTLSWARNSRCNSGNRRQY
jgi:hypothetical protein